MEKDNKTQLDLKNKVREEQELRRRAETTLGKFVAQVQENEKTTRQIDLTEEEIYKAESLEELLRGFIKQIKTRFNIPVVKVSLIEEGAATKTIIDLVPFDVLSEYYYLVRAKELKGLPEIDRVPALVNAEIERFTDLFSERDLTQIKSLALVPIFTGRQLAGVVGFGSFDENHYNPSNDTSLLEKLGRRFSISLDKVLSKEKLRRAHEKLKEVALKDGLTGLANYTLMHRVLSREFSRTKRYKTPLTVAYIDLDNFKQINDSLGHDVGDEVLKYFAQQLGLLTRTTDMPARKSGDEFVVIFPGTEKIEAEKFFIRLREVLKNKPLLQNGKTVLVAFSFGVASFDGGDNQLSVEKFLKKADQALYQDKEVKNKR